MTSEEARLRSALAAMKNALQIEQTVESMFGRIARAAQACAKYLISDGARLRTDLADPTIQSALADAAEALKENIHSAKDGRHISPRRARALAKFIWSDREELGAGRPVEYDPHILVPFRDEVEMIAGRSLTVSHTRNRKAPLGQAATGLPQSEMLEVMMAALAWAWAIHGIKARTINPEGLNTALKRLRPN